MSLFPNLQPNVERKDLEAVLSYRLILKRNHEKLKEICYRCLLELFTTVGKQKN